ncbi:MAG: glycosyltransferase family 2 protein [Thermoflexales bacterium]|nr:glycosyltransferase family 2 protein [Thermoflexales bacterium]
MEPCTYVVILNWRRPDDTLACIQSVQASRYPNTRLLVVDNGSGDESVSRISAAYPGVALLALPENLGFAGGNNAGIRHALEGGAELVLVLNNDTVVEPDTLSELVRGLAQAGGSIGVPKICYYDEPGRIWAAGARWRRFPPRVTMVGFGKWDAPEYNQPGELSYATGCALLIGRSVFEAIGGFDPAFVNYQEDYDFCYRARQAGHRLAYVPQAVVRHKVSQSLGQQSPARWHYLGRNAVLFYRPGERFSWGALGSFLAWVVLREIVQGNLSRLPAYLGGVREGLAVLQQAPSVEDFRSL